MQWSEQHSTESLRLHLIQVNFNLKLPSLVPGSPIKIDFKITALLDPNDGLPPSDLTPENAIVRVILIKAGHVS